MSTLPPIIACIDFEASSLGSAGFPIEVGIAVGEAGDHQIDVWSTLIRPYSTWSMTSGWSPKSERVHRIAPSALRDGMEPAAVLTHLNDALSPLGCAWCDGGDYDRFWFERLCKAAPLVKPAFELRDVSELSLLPSEREAMTAALARSHPDHRAGADAERICLAVMEVCARRL